MKVPITKDQLDGFRQRLIEAEEEGDKASASFLRSDYRKACAWAYSAGDLVFKDSTKERKS